jgi:hypothetical protein
MMAFASAYDTFPGDVWLTRRLQEVDSEAVGTTLRWASRMVEWPYWVITALAGTFYGLRKAGPRVAPVVILGLLVRFLNYPVLKELTGRPRPSPDDVEVERALSTLSFPSGHAYNAVILYGLIFFLVTLYARSQWVRRSVQGLCIAIIAGTGLERVPRIPLAQRCGRRLSLRRAGSGTARDAGSLANGEDLGVAALTLTLACQRMDGRVKLTLDSWGVWSRR